MIAIIDYKAGNVASVKNALFRLGVESTVTDDTALLDMADAVIFPGVGHAAPAMERLRERGLDGWIRQTKKPLLGICLGMQLLFSSTEEGDTESLNIIPGRLLKFDSVQVKTPHMGWNNIQTSVPEPLLADAGESPFYYFVHSYYAPITVHTAASCFYQIPFAAVVRKDNFCGVQFHPEKSGDLGSMLLKQFLKSRSETGM
jgi:glutamine amidotransferase